MSIFGSGNSGGYSWATVDVMETNLPILQQNLKLQSRQTKDQFALINVTTVELGDPRKSLHTLELTLFWLQHRYI